MVQTTTGGFLYSSTHNMPLILIKVGKDFRSTNLEFNLMSYYTVDALLNCYWILTPDHKSPFDTNKTLAIL